MEVEEISSLLITILLIGVLVVAHEFGHFIVAKKSGICVEEFAIGMGPKVFSRQKGETEYSIRMLPLGGFCRMEGENEEGGRSEHSFFGKSIGVRLAVMAAGPFMNFLLAFLMIFGLTATSYIATPQIREILPASAAEECGLQAGDVIYRINGERIHIYDELQYLLQGNAGEPILLEVISQDGMLYCYELQPKLDEAQNRYLIGFTPMVQTGLFAEPMEDFPKAGFGDTLYYSYYSMLNYAEGNPGHTGMGFFVVCDDTEREYGSEEKAAEYYSEVEKQGWTPFSMANDWKTIYGDGVQKTELPGAEEALPNAA